MRMIYVTCPNTEEARSITLALLKERLITCSNIFPEIQSHYMWEGKMVEDTECVLMLKTSENVDFALIEKTVRSVHSYKCPAIIELPVNNVNDDYNDWITANTIQKS